MVSPFISNETFLEKQLQGRAYFIGMTWKWLKSQCWGAPSKQHGSFTVSCAVCREGWRPDMPWSYLLATCSMREALKWFMFTVFKNKAQTNPAVLGLLGKQPWYCKSNTKIMGIHQIQMSKHFMCVCVATHSFASQKWGEAACPASRLFLPPIALGWVVSWGLGSALCPRDE